MGKDLKQILLTNDDGILSPGLWAAAGALAGLGYVTVAAPKEQYSGAGRSFPTNSDGKIETHRIRVNGKNWTAYAVGGSPAQVVLHGALEIMPQKPDLVVSGINFGENLGTGITGSGTVGAALEAAGISIPAMAVSLETLIEHHYTHSDDVDFQAAAHFTKLFAEILLNHPMPPDVDVLKIDVPMDANSNTPWEVTKISRVRLFEVIPPQRETWLEPGKVGYQFASNWTLTEPGSDIHAVHINKQVSVTPLSLDLTSRINLREFEQDLRNQQR